MKSFLKNEYYLVIASSALIFTEFYYFNLSSRALISNKYLVINTINLLIFSAFFFYILITFLGKANKSFLSLNKIKNIFIIYFTIIYYKIFQIPFFYSNTITFKSLINNILIYLLPENFYFLIFFLKITIPFFVIFFLIIFLYNKNLRVILNFFYSFSIIFFLIMSWDISKRLYYLDITEINDSKTITDRQVIWFILDEYDPSYINDKKSNINLKYIKNLSKYSVIHNQVYSPSNSTLHSVPSTILGTQTNGSTIEDYQLKILNKQNEKITFNFENTFFKQLNENNFKFSIISEVLPYCSLLQIESFCKKNFNQFKYYTDSIKQAFFFTGYFDKLSDKFKKKNKEFNIEKLTIFNENGKYNQLLLSEKLELKISDLKNIVNTKDNLIFFHLFIPHTDSPTSKYVERFFDMVPGSDDEEYILNLKYTDILINQISNIINSSDNDDILLLLTSDHWRRNDSPLSPKPSLFISKIKKDLTKHEVNGDISNIFIPSLIIKYLNKEIDSHKDIKLFLKNQGEFDKNEVYIWRK